MARVCIQDYEGFSPQDIQYATDNNAMKFAKIPGGEGFDDITQNEVNNIIDTHSETATDEDLLELTQSANEEEEGAPVLEGEEDVVSPTVEHLSDLLRTIKELQRKTEA